MYIYSSDPGFLPARHEFSVYADSAFDSNLGPFKFSFSLGGVPRRLHQFSQSSFKNMQKMNLNGTDNFGSSNKSNQILTSSEITVTATNSNANIYNLNDTYRVLFAVLTTKDILN